MKNAIRTTILTGVLALATAPQGALANPCDNDPNGAACFTWMDKYVYQPHFRKQDEEKKRREDRAIDRQSPAPAAGTRDVELSAAEARAAEARARTEALLPPRLRSSAVTSAPLPPPAPSMEASAAAPTSLDPNLRFVGRQGMPTDWSSASGRNAAKAASNEPKLSTSERLAQSPNGRTIPKDESVEAAAKAPVDESACARSAGDLKDPKKQAVAAAIQDRFGGVAGLKGRWAYKDIAGYYELAALQIESDGRGFTAKYTSGGKTVPGRVEFCPSADGALDVRVIDGGKIVQRLRAKPVSGSSEQLFLTPLTGELAGKMLRFHRSEASASAHSPTPSAFLGRK